MDFRDATEADLPLLLALSQAFFSRYAADGQEPPQLEDFGDGWLNHTFPIVFTIPSKMQTSSGWISEDIPVGYAWFDSFNDNLSAHAHLIIRPAYIKTVLKEFVFQDALEDRFRVTGVKRFLVLSSDYNAGQTKLLRRFGLNHLATLPEQVYFQGEARDVHYWSITRKELAKALRLRFIAEELPEEKVNPKVVDIPRRRGRPRKDRTTAG